MLYSSFPLASYFTPGSVYMLGFPGGSVVKNLPDNFDSWVRKIPWRRKWQPTPIFLPGKSHGQRNLGGYSPWSHKSWTQLSNLTTTTVYMSMPLSKFVPTSPPVSTSLLSMSVSLLLPCKWVHQYHFLESIYIYMH